MENTTAYPGTLRVGTNTPRGFDANVQSIASAAHKRGVVLIQRDQVVGSIEAAELCKLLRAAHENTRGNDYAHAHVEQITGGIAVKIGAKGPVEIGRLALNLLTGYARPKAAKNGKGAR